MSLKARKLVLFIVCSLFFLCTSQAKASPGISSLSPASGVVGTSVTIAGANFGMTQGTSTVAFNGTTATITGWGASGISAIVPPGATTGNVVVTVSGVASNGSKFSVITLASIAVTPQSPVIAAGNTQQFTATGKYSDNTTQNLTSTATWTSTASGVATINSSALAAAVGSGQTTIQASVGTVRGSTQLTVPGFVLTGSLATARCGQTATLLNNGSILINGGYDINGSALANAELYNPTTGTFTATGNLNTARTNHTATLLDDGTVLIVGGFDINANLLASAELYNPVTGAFTFAGSLGTPRADHTATLLIDGKVLIAGSYDSAGNPSASAELYDPSSGTFSPSGSLNTARGRHSATLLNDGTVLVLGGAGNDGIFLESAELYNPTTGTFTATGGLNTARIQHTATLLNSGSVLVAGGQDSNYDVLSIAELYNPTAKTFTLTGNLNTGRGNHAATLLNNGIVLLEGGFGSAADMMSSAELFDPVAGTFAATGSLNVARQAHTATLLANGLVLVAGGFSDNPRALSSAELYQVATLVPPNLVSIVVSPVNPSIPTGTAQNFTATGTFSDNSTQALASVAWSSSNNAVATISDDLSNHGVALGEAIGVVTLSACTGSICGSATMAVVAPDPEIELLSPSSGPVGSSLTVTGSGFGAIQGTSTVLLNQTPVLVTSWTPTCIVAIVPNETTGNVIVQIGAVTSNLVEFAVLPTPFIAEISPINGDVGSTMEISGANFGDTQGSGTATLNGTAITVTSWSATDITGTVATGATTGNVIVSVSGVPSNSVTFTVLNVPEILSLSPTLGPAGTSVTISGSDFGATQGPSTVAFNGLMASVTGWNSTTISATVPTGATTGLVVVDVAGTISNGVLFISPGAPNILSLAPVTAPIGGSVAITGTNFGANQGTSTVSFDGALAATTSWSSTQILVTVPPGATSGNVNVTASGVTGTAAFFSVFTAPIISSVSPTTGEAGSSFVINGSHFGTTQGTSTVTINGIPASIPNDWTDQAIVVVVPAGATTGNLVVTIMGVSANAGIYTVNPTPVISSLSKISGVVGTQVTITGTNFGTTPGTVGISGGDSSSYATWNNTSVVFNIPTGSYGTYTGNVYVITSLGVGENGGYQPFFLVLPSISGQTPASGTVGTSVQINGYGFGADQTTGTLTFNGKVATPVSWSPTQIVAYPPVGSTTGNVVVVVSGNSSAGVNFTVLPGPAISALSASNGVAGTSVTITGTAFGNSQGSSTVTFNGTAAPQTAWNGTSISVSVPTRATTGNVAVTVGGVASNGVGFTVDSTPAISNLSQNSGSVGTSITIYGSNFLGAQGSSTVTFNGNVTTPTIWSVNSIAVTVPNGATTGNIVVTVLGLASAGVRFTVTAAPTISSLSPSSGPAGILVSVNGSNFGSSQGASLVTFNGVLASPTSWASVLVKAPVPPGATSGPLIVTVNDGLSNNSTFTVTSGPGITSVSPTSGGIGATVIILGAGFGASQGTSSVKFNGTLTSPASWNDTSISLPVPSGAATGSIVATVGGVASNGASFTVSSGLTVMSVNPNSGNTGSSVIITGTGFGTTQGSSKVTFNGTTATIALWTGTSITTSVPSAATSGPLVVSVGGASSDGIYFTAQPQLNAISPNPAALGTTVTIAGDNFGAAQGASVLTCNGTPGSVSSWSSSSINVAECVANPGNFAISIPIQITVNGISSTVASIQGIPDALLINEYPTTAAVGTPILVRGMNLGATQGQSSITINGAAATPTSWSDIGIVVPVPAGATAIGQINVVVGGANAYPWIIGPTVGALPVPNSLQITPAGVNMLIGGIQQFVVLDDQHRVRYDATWAIDNTTLATITTDSSPTLTATAAGTVTLTATVQGVSAQMPVTISAAISFPVGTILWSAPAVPGFSPSQIAQAEPSSFGPSVFSIEKSTSGTQTLVQAFTADGLEMWQTTLRALTGNVVPDGYGGLLATQICDSVNSMTLVDLNGVSGQSVWQATITPANGGGSGCPLDWPKIAVRQDGAVVVAAPANTLPSLLILDGPSGQVLAIPSIPTSTGTDYTGQLVSLPATMGSPIAYSDGSIYEEYEIREIPYPATTVSSILWLVQVATDGSTTTTQLSSSDTANLFPGTLIPDGTGGVVSTWTIAPVTGPPAPYPYQAADVSFGGVNAYNMPMAPTQVVNGSNGLPVNPTLVLGENGTAFASYGSNMASFNVSGGSANWNYQAPSQTSISLVTLVPSNGLAIKTTDQTGTDSLTRFDTGGNSTAVAGTGTTLSYSWQGDWNDFTNGVLSSVVLPFVPVNTVSTWAQPGGSSSSQSKSVTNHSMGFFVCGVAIYGQGYMPNTPCPQGGGNDVRWGYYKDSPGMSGFQDFSSAHPDWVTMIVGQAMVSLRKAYVPYGVQVVPSSQTGQSLDQEYTAFIVGDYPYPGSGQDFSDNASKVFYFSAMDGAEEALGNPVGGGWNDFMPDYPPSQQATAAFVNLIRTIGIGLGNASAHEMAHHLETVRNITSNNLLGMGGMPYIDCGLSSENTRQGLGPLDCENHDNFVYGFFNGDGFPNYGNSQDTGAMFYYGVLGGTPGVPVQPPIHWGPSDICWLQNYVVPGSCNK